MADRGRDLSVKVTADASNFDVSEPADQLETLADNATDATDELKRLALQGKDAERELDRLNATTKANDLDTLGKDARDTATKVDAAFDKIAKSSRANLGKVDDDAKRAGKGLDDFKEEAAGSGREAAASFSGGFDDIAGSVQEIAANAFAGFGPLGAAAGLVGAAGLGILTTALTAVNERVQALTDAFVDAKLSGGGMADAVTAALDNLRDNNQLAELAKDAERFGIDWQTLVRAMAGSEPDIAIVGKRLDELSDGATAAGMSGGHATIAYRNLAQIIGWSGEAMADASLIARAYTEGMGAVPATLDETTTATAELTDAQKEHADALERVKGAMDSVGDSAVANAVKEADSIDDIIRAQRKALAAQRDFQKNTKEVLDEVGQDGVDWALQFGENAPKAMQMLADAPKAKQATIAKQYAAAGRLATSKTAEGMTADIPKVETAAERAHAAAQARMEDPLDVSVRVNAPSTAQLNAMRRHIVDGIGPVVLNPPTFRGGSSIFYRTVP